MEREYPKGGVRGFREPTSRPSFFDPPDYGDDEEDERYSYERDPDDYDDGGDMDYSWAWDGRNMP